MVIRRTEVVHGVLWVVDYREQGTNLALANAGSPLTEPCVLYRCKPSDLYTAAHCVWRGRIILLNGDQAHKGSPWGAVGGRLSRARRKHRVGKRMVTSEGLL